MRKSQVTTEFVQQRKFRHFKIIRIFRKGEYFLRTATREKRKFTRTSSSVVWGSFRGRNILSEKQSSFRKNKQNGKKNLKNFFFPNLPPSYIHVFILMAYILWKVCRQSSLFNVFICSQAYVFCCIKNSKFQINILTSLSHSFLFVYLDWVQGHSSTMSSSLWILPSVVTIPIYISSGIWFL